MARRKPATNLGGLWLTLEYSSFRSHVGATPVTTHGPFPKNFSSNFSGPNSSILKRGTGLPINSGSASGFGGGTQAPSTSYTTLSAQ